MDDVDVLAIASIVMTDKEKIRADAIRKFAEEVNRRINEILQEPNYQHDGEDWKNGLLIAQSILKDAEELKE